MNLLVADPLTLYQYVRQNGLETSDVVFGVIGVAVLACGIYFGQQLLVPSKRPKHMTYNDLLTPFWCAFIATVYFLMVYAETRSRYLLREGAYRYTVAHVTKHGMRRGYRQFVYRYTVAGEELQGAQDCGVSRNRELPCPPLGTRYYVQFSPEDPGTDHITQREVPDSVRTIPPLGWEKLP